LGIAKAGLDGDGKRREFQGCGQIHA
jgi:hypothetical protein